MLCANASCLSPAAGATGTAAGTFAAAVNFLAAAQCLLPETWPPDADVADEAVFDMIIVGAGSAGSVVAHRLSEIAQWKILLIDAGGDPPVESTIPRMSPNLQNTKFDWQYKTEDNGIVDQACVNGSVPWPRGKMLGGSSSINGMVYLKGNYYDYLKWFKEGNREWHPINVRRYFKKAENLQSEILLRNYKTSKEYGKSGPLAINTFNSTIREYTDLVLAAFDDVGFKNVDDLNSANLMGSGMFTATANGGMRQSTAHAYLKGLEKRNNIQILKNALVTKVLIDAKNKTAYGVQILKNDKLKTFYTRKEVILSAGSINTPQLLMLSGIGSKSHLESKSVKTVVDLPSVGQNLQDHIIVPVTIYGNNPSALNEADKSFDSIKYLYDRTGSLAVSNLADITALYSNNLTAQFPDFQSHLILFHPNSSSLVNNVAKYKSEVRESVLKQNKDKSLYMFLFTLLHPRSRGNISLLSNDPTEYPLIYPNYFADQHDLNMTVEGIQKLTKIVGTTHFKQISGEIGRMEWGPCNEFEIDSKEYWSCISMNMVTTIYHPVGTSKMGVNPKTSVVDSRLKVHKVRNLRVIDASIMPTVTSCNTNGPTIMIGELGSDLIKQDYGVFT